MPLSLLYGGPACGGRLANSISWVARLSAFAPLCLGSEIIMVFVTIFSPQIEAAMRLFAVAAPHLTPRCDPRRFATWQVVETVSISVVDGA
jgi:hypothetical protein